MGSAFRRREKLSGDLSRRAFGVDLRQIARISSLNYSREERFGAFSERPGNRYSPPEVTSPWHALVSAKDGRAWRARSCGPWALGCALARGLQCWSLERSTPFCAAGDSFATSERDFPIALPFWRWRTGKIPAKGNADVLRNRNVAPEEPLSSFVSAS